VDTIASERHGPRFEQEPKCRTSFSFVKGRKARLEEFKHGRISDAKRKKCFSKFDHVTGQGKKRIVGPQRRKILTEFSGLEKAQVPAGLGAVFQRREAEMIQAIHETSPAPPCTFGNTRQPALIRTEKRDEQV
jgi:hypothetical protein